MNKPRTFAPCILSVAAGMALWFLASAKLSRPEPWDDAFYWAVVYPLAILISGFLGALFPGRAWRWALALFSGQFAGMMIRNGEAGNLWPLGLLLFGVMAIPGAILASLGSWARGKLNSE